MNVVAEFRSCRFKLQTSTESMHCHIMGAFQPTGCTFTCMSLTTIMPEKVELLHQTFPLSLVICFTISMVSTVSLNSWSWHETNWMFWCFYQFYKTSGLKCQALITLPPPWCLLQMWNPVEWNKTAPDQCSVVKIWYKTLKHIFLYTCFL